MPYWLSLFADMPARSYRPDAARAILDAARPEGCGLRAARAARDDAQAAIWHERMGPERCANAALHTFGPYTGFQTTHLKETT